MPHIGSIAPRTLRVCIAFLSCALATSFSFAAQPARKSFDLPSDSAERALKQFSQQSGVQVLFASEIAEGVRTNAVKGELTPLEAAHQLLAGTDLYVVSDEQTGVLSVARTPREGPGKKASRAAPIASDRPANSSAAQPDQPVVLSPFEVAADTRGYYAANTMSGTRLNSKLEDLGSSISVVTKEQMHDFAMIDLNDIFAYEANTEGTGNFTDYEIDRRGNAVDNIVNNPQGANRIRGIGAANTALGNFSTSGRAPTDPSTFDSVEISRGPNSNIFGLGNAAGTVNLVPSTANLRTNSAQTQLRGDSYDGWRASLDINRVLKPGVLAVRGSAVRQHEGFVRKPSGLDTKRYNAMVKFQPFKFTTLRAAYFAYHSEGTRANAVTPRDAISYWKDSGSPTWDPVTFTAKLNGAAVGTYPTGSALPSYFRENNFMSRSALFIDQAGLGLWSVQQTPSGSNPSSPNQSVRFLESSFNNGVRTNQPLFSTWPAVTNRNLYDWESVNLSSVNFVDDDDRIATAELEQIFFNNGRHLVAAQLGWFRETAKRYNRNLVGNAASAGIGSLLQIDVNERLLDGSPNPYFLRPFLGIAEPHSLRDTFDSDTYRAQVVYKMDFSQERGWKAWLGELRLVGYSEYKDTKTRNYRYRDVMRDVHSFVAAGNPRGNQAAPAGAAVARGFFHYYVGDNQGANVDHAPSGFTPGTYPFRWYNGSTRQWITENAELGEVATTDNSGGTQNRWNVLKTSGLVLQSHLLQGRVVATLGARQDKNFTQFGGPAALTADGLEFDYDKMRAWNGAWNMRSGYTKTAGVVVKPRPWVSVYVNKSDSFQPTTPSQNLQRKELPNPSGEGKDYGFALNLFEGKLVVRANQYETKQINSPFGQSGTFAQRILSADFVEFNNSSGPRLNEAARAWTITEAAGRGVTLTEAQIQTAVYSTLKLTPQDFAEFQRLPITDVGDITGKGKEIEINYNPTKSWTLKLNGAQQVAINSKLSPALLAWAQTRLPVWQTVRNPSTGALWWTTNFSTTQTPETFYRDSVLAPIKLEQATEGQARPQVRKYRVNASTNFRLSGITDHRILKRFNVGGAVRWEDKGAIGYYGLQQLPAQITELDPNRPIWDKSRYYVDAFIAYRTKMFNDKIGAKFQVNVRNLGENGRLQAIGAYPDGTRHSFRIVDPQQFIFTATFDL